ncbi:hypothetical protein SPRG_01296 [Saprolegnia parasitica CBS 223.65]|uniref:PH domain-containing protein n=1 Tax=Saprolegnia parasitica (strain CBS 223.65) TaxID=695850 RepID=A0A067D4S3_SAPPC|nr:hypothetical protein SPRG_01296 [Saprolegnia parasitica CBS 223.65]KDO34022.1 hypothetical protein SPRG_01296 [Saprolegnia parasitica CBS 223.65]|eukprot:XP_012194907.1 hypothetical protein SPRG_01296 [Saprolegnia parasitica CBS 223.65]
MPTISGWLRLKSVSGLMSLWRRRFFVLKDTSLYEYDSEDTFAGGFKQTRRLLSVRRVASSALTFHIVVAGAKKPKSYYLATYDSGSFEQWRKAFVTCCGPSIAKLGDDMPATLLTRSPSHYSSSASTASSGLQSIPILVGDDVDRHWRQTDHKAADAMTMHVLFPDMAQDDVDRYTSSAPPSTL